MANIKKYQTRRLKIKGGEAQLVQVQGTDINVLRFINWGQTDLRISQHSDPQNYPEVVITGNGGTNNMMDPAGISRVFIYAAADVQFGLVEVQMDDPMLILAMESVVANLMTALPAGTAHVGSMSIDNNGNPVSQANRLPVEMAAFDMSDRIARVLGHAIIDSMPAADITDRIARVLGHVIIDSLPAADVTDRAARALGLVGPAAGSVWAVKPATGVAPVEVIFALAETKAVKAAAGRVFAIVAKGCDVTLQDGAGAIWFVPAGTSFSFPRPAECAASIQVTSSAAGNAYVQYE